MAILIPGTGATGPIQTLIEFVKNTSGGTLDKGTPVQIVGNTGQEANVVAADASTAFPANFVLAETLTPGESGQAVALGFINNVSVPNASLFTAGQEVYLAVGGGWTTTRPTGTANIQLLGNIVKVNTGANTISGIFAPQNIEYLPNLTQGKVWVGSAAGVPEESDPAFSGQIINGVAHFVSTTAPTFRRNAAGQNIGTLVAGDRWYNPSTGNTAFLYGTRWLSTERLSLDFVIGASITATGGSNTDKRLPPDSFIDGWSLSLDATGTQDVSNNFTLTFNVAATGGTHFIGSSLARSPYWRSHIDGDIVYETGPTDPTIISNIPFSQFPNPNPGQSIQARATFTWTETGSSAFNYSFNLWYRRILG